MRISHQMLSRNYLKRMNTNLSNLTQSNERMSSQRAYNKSYENVSDAGKALKIRKLIADDERHLTTIRDAQGRASAAEDALRTVDSLMIRAKDRLVEGMNGTMSQDDRDKIAAELERARDEVFQIMNTSFADKPLFAASGNANGSPPFSVDASGALLYNGSPVDDLVAHPTTGKPVNPDLSAIPYNTDNYVDIGFGLSLTSAGKVDPNTAFKDTYSGIENFGFGVNDDGVPLNAYSLFDRMVQDLRSGNMEGMGNDLNAISDSMEFLLTSITEIGARGVTLEDTAARLENEYINLAEIQNKLEGIDLSREAIFNKDYEMSWMVTLQLGSKILPQTIFDFIR